MFAAVIDQTGERNTASQIALGGADRDEQLSPSLAGRLHLAAAVFVRAQRRLADLARLIYEPLLIVLRQPFPS